MNIIAHKVTLRTVFGAWVNSPLPGTREEVEAQVKAHYAAMGLEVIDVRLQFSEGEPTVPVQPEPEPQVDPFPYRRAKFKTHNDTTPCQ